MNIKQILVNLQRFVPHFFLYKLQEIHSRLILNWILQQKSQPLKVNQRSAIVFSPHQDDETLGCGGIIALKRELGIPVRVIFLTNGEKGIADNIQPDRIIQTRQQEAISALSILGVEPTSIHFLSQPDGELAKLETKRRQDLIEQITGLLHIYKPEEVYVPHYKDCHIDHEATYPLVQAAIAHSGLNIEILQYPIWLLWRSPLFIMLKLRDLAYAQRISIAAVQEKKLQAIQVYNSQMQILPSGFLKLFSGSHEVFFKPKLQ